LIVQYNTIRHHDYRVEELLASIVVERRELMGGPGDVDAGNDFTPIVLVDAGGDVFACDLVGEHDLARALAETTFLGGAEGR
jgi:hypothetical protein